MSLPVLSYAPVTLRHIKRAATGTTVLGATLAAQSPVGVNGDGGYQSGRYESVLSDEGTATVTFANAVGGDGILHRRRFACLTDPDYRIGDEWIEIWEGHPGRGRLLFVGAPTDWEKRRATITLELVEGAWLLNTERETAAGFWHHAPRDVFEHYTKAWRTIVADDFLIGADTARWTKVNGTGAVTDLTGSVQLFGPGASLTARADYWGTIALASQRAWRLEMTYSRDFLPHGTPQAVRFEVVDLSDPTVLIRAGITLSEAYTQVDTRGADYVTAGSDINFDGKPNPAKRANASLAIEVRDRWVLFYVDSVLIGSRELDITSDTGAQVVPRIAIQGGLTTSGIQIHEILLRRVDSYLMRGADKGDYRLPGNMPAGGLQGAYHDEADLRTYADTRKYARRVLAPTRKPYARRQDATLAFTPTSPAAWQPSGPPSGEYFSVQWTGAIYLDLATADVTLRLDQVNSARLWVGKTMYGEELLSNWFTFPIASAVLTSGSLRTYTGGSHSGWYSIRVDYRQGSGVAGFSLQQSIGGGAYGTVPASALSPFGCYNAEVRYDSHAEQLKGLVTAFGLQYRCEPRSLESSLFPGELVPRMRVGRDTEKQLTPDESTDVSVKGSATEVVDTLLADAAGLGDQGNTAQLTAESVNYPSVWSTTAIQRHMMIQSAYESLADITDPVLLQTRLASMLGLRLTPWEEVAARPRGHRELLGAFPIILPAALALFAWEPGDGLRIMDEALDLADDTPRQIIAPIWQFSPDGLGAPTVRFHQRPRSQQDALRAIVRAVLLPQRNYQGQLVVVNGSVGAQPATSYLPDNYSRVSIPVDITDIVQAELVVQYKDNTSTWTITVNGVSTGITFATAGHYSILAFVAREINMQQQRMYVGITGGTGSVEYSVALVVRV